MRTQGVLAVPCETFEESRNEWIPLKPWAFVGKETRWRLPLSPILYCAGFLHLAILFTCFICECQCRSIGGDVVRINTWKTKQGNARHKMYNWFVITGLGWSFYSPINFFFATCLRDSLYIGRVVNAACHIDRSTFQVSGSCQRN